MCTQFMSNASDDSDEESKLFSDLDDLAQFDAIDLLCLADEGLLDREVMTFLGKIPYINHDSMDQSDPITDYLDNDVPL